MSLNNDEIVEMLDSFDKDSKALIRNLMRLCWYMRGGVTYDEIMFMSHHEFEAINDVIKENLDTTKESGLPFF